jgi:hypothetical protein
LSAKPETIPTLRNEAQAFSPRPAAKAKIRARTVPKLIRACTDLDAKSQAKDAPGIKGERRRTKGESQAETAFN